jgi:hypothetical protein
VYIKNKFMTPNNFGRSRLVIFAPTGVASLDLLTEVLSANRWPVCSSANNVRLAASLIGRLNQVALSRIDLHHRAMPQSPRTSTPTEVLAGLVERVTFHNEENGFCVLRVKARGQRDLIAVLGHAAMISAGEFVQASGSWINDRTHGVQFRASFLKATSPTTIEGIEKYLSSGMMIRGIGPVCPNVECAFYEIVFDISVEEPIAIKSSPQNERIAPHRYS